MKIPMAWKLGVPVDIIEKSQAYVQAQLAIMDKFGGRPELSSVEYEKLIMDCAKPLVVIWKRRQVR